MNTTLNMPFYQRINPRQVVKWTVYILLLLNWSLYIAEDWQTAQHTLRDGGTVLQWASTFGTSLDLAAWFGLLFLWEVETYMLSDEADTPFVRSTFLAIRAVCYILLAHTVFSRAVTVYDLSQLEALPGITSLCQLEDNEFSFANNVHYTLIDQRNCASLSTGQRFYAIESTAVTDESGFAVERRSTFVDLGDAITWLLIMLTIEIAIWQQERNITGGPAMLISHAGKILYSVLFANAAYWAYLGHWLYSWDQLLWIGGFFAIEMNLSDWRKDIQRHINTLKAKTLSGAKTISGARA
jgi:hypothetical protein